jgi:hypothetical protein
LARRNTPTSSTGWRSCAGFCQREGDGTGRALICGDFNIAPADVDVHDPEFWAGKMLCSEAERDALESIRQWGWIDLFRRHHPEGGHFSRWDYRAGGFRRNHGLRIDHIWANEQNWQIAVLEAWIDKIPRALEKPSDHAPVVAEFNESPDEQGENSVARQRPHRLVEMPARLGSMDAYRGFGHVSDDGGGAASLEALRRPIRRASSGACWRSTSRTLHWFGCTLHDLIQPSFSFLVGVALPYSLASREARGQIGGQGLAARELACAGADSAWVSSCARSAIRRRDGPSEDTLSQIGMGYLFLFALGHRSIRASSGEHSCW